MQTQEQCESWSLASVNFKHNLRIILVFPLARIWWTDKIPFFYYIFYADSGQFY